MPPESGSTRSFAAVGQLDEVEELVGALRALLARQAEVAPVDQEVLADGQLVVERVVLRHHAEPRADLRAVPARVHARGRAARRR